MKEGDNRNQDKKGLWRRATATGVIIAALAGCGESPIEEGIVYKKQYIDESIILIPQIVGSSQFLRPTYIPEEWKIYIAQCPKGELPPQEKIKKECKTNSFDVPQEVFNKLQISQYADFKQTK